jgi:hypothetical protein
MHPRTLMDQIHTDKKTFAQLTDDELDGLVARGQYQPYAVEERTYRTSMRLIAAQEKMLVFASKLDRQTATLIRLTRAVIVFTVVLVALTVGLFVEGGLQFCGTRKDAKQAPQNIQQINQAGASGQHVYLPKK